MVRAIETFFRWVATLEWVPPIFIKIWHALLQLSLGEWIAILALMLAVVLSGAAAANRFFMCYFHMPVPRASLPPDPPKKGFGIKHLVLLLIALLPGGLVGSVVAYAIMGKEGWRRSTLYIVGLSLIPALMLGVLRYRGFPHPEWRDAIYIGGVIGLTFGVLQLWICTKLLREYFGEPDVCVPWWPPLSLWIQTAMLVGGMAVLLNRV